MLMVQTETYILYLKTLDFSCINKYNVGKIDD